MAIVGQGHRPRINRPNPFPEPTMDEPSEPKVDGVFNVGDPVRINGQSAKLWHVQTVDPDRASEGTIRITPDCGCGGPAWVAPDMLLHDTYG